MIDYNSFLTGIFFILLAILYELSSIVSALREQNKILGRRYTTNED